MEQEKVCTKCGVSKPRSAFSKDKAAKDGLQPRCKICGAEYYRQNKERIAERGAEHYRQNKERIAERKAEYQQQNKELIAKRKAEYRRQNKERIAEYKAEHYRQNKERIAERGAEHRQRNKAQYVEYTNRRRRGLRNQSIAKTFAKQNSAVYRWAEDCRQLTGVEFHVDHICPVKAQVYDPQFDTYLPATGLHVPWNLDPKPASQNLKKNNRVTLDDILHTPKFSPR